MTNAPGGPGTPDGRRRAVVTGVGLVSPLGDDPEAFFSALLSGRSAVQRIERFDPSGFPTRIAAEVAALEPQEADAGAERWNERGRIALFAARAARRALADARLPGGEGWREGAGLVLAAGLGSYGHAEVFAPVAAATRKGTLDGRLHGETLLRTLEPLAADRRTPGAIASALAREHRLGGPVMAVMTACAGGTQALGDALAWVRDGRAGVVLAGASDSELYPMGLASFCLLGALSTRNDEPARASRPFDAGRDGFVLGEGAAFLVVEEEARARERGARLYAELAGFGSACDAYRATDPHPEGRGAVLAMERALADARLDPAGVSWVNAHGTSTPEGDRVEAHAIRAVFGDRRVPVSSTKSMIGHLTVAAGAVEAVACVLALAHGAIHPTLNQETPDPEAPLDTVPAARRLPLTAVLSSSFAFGGQTASVVFRRPGP